jgi:acyl carrier protein
MSTALDRLQNAFRTALNLPDPVEWKEVAYGQTEGWDSVAHMALIAAIEIDFDIMIDTDDVIGMSSFAKAREILAKHGVPT